MTHFRDGRLGIDKLEDREQTRNVVEALQDPKSAVDLQNRQFGAPSDLTSCHLRLYHSKTSLQLPDKRLSLTQAILWSLYRR